LKFTFISANVPIVKDCSPATPRTAALATDLRVLVGQVRRRLREQWSLGDLTESQIAVLRRLDSDGPATVSTLARAEGMRPQSMGANIAGLQAAGLVSGTPDPNDGRQTLLSMTAECREKVKAGRIAKDDWLCRTLQTKLTPAEQAELARAVELLKRLVES
jgi:DNA-binding MarR family transcriptional regulator